MTRHVHLVSRNTDCRLLRIATIWVIVSVKLPTLVLGQPPSRAPESVPPAAVNPPTNPAAIAALSQGLLIDVRKLVEMVRLELDVTPAGQQLGARVNLMLGTADHFNRAVIGKESLPQLMDKLAELQQAHQAVSAELAQPVVNREAPGSVRMNQRIGNRIAQLQTALPQASVRPMPGPSPEALLHRALKRELTGLIGEVDLFVAGLNPKVPEGPQLQAEALALQNSLKAVRRDFNKPAPEPMLLTDFNHTLASYRVLSARVERLNQGRVGPNVQRIRNIGTTLNRIRQAVPGL